MIFLWHSRDDSKAGIDSGWVGEDNEHPPPAKGSGGLL